MNFRYLEMAARVSSVKDIRNHRLGAVGIRKDGAIVIARNQPTKMPHAEMHAEFRLCRKLDAHSVVYVARTSRSNGEWALAKPCPICEIRLRSRGVSKVYYTIAPNEYGTLILSK